MKKTMITVAAAFIVMETMVASVEEANAVVCARGVYCAGPRGAVVARRPVVVPRRVVVAPRGVVVAPRGVVVRRPFIETLLC